jgi:4-aminobutyrate aminotransferase-like enzyme
MIFEPIISGGGLLFPPRDYLEVARQLCDDNGILLIFDECQTGMGRLGTWFGFQKVGIVPDAITTSKGLGAGFPVGAVVMDGSLVPADGFQMQYFSSHQNEPFAGAISSFVVQRIRNESLLSAVGERGAQLHAVLEKLERDSNQIFCARGDGLLRGFDLEGSAHDNKASARGPRLTEIALEEGLMLQHCNYGNTVRILPNYLCTEAEIDEFGVKLKIALSRLGSET